MVSGVLFLQASARGEVLLDTLGQDLWNADTVDSTTWLAQSFNSGGYTKLSDVTLNLYDGTTGGQFDLELYTSSGVGGPPGSFFASLGSSLSVPTTTDSENRFQVTLPESLVLPSAPADYYVVLKLTSGSVSWGYMGSVPTGEYAASYSYQYSGGNWTSEPDPESYPHRMFIEAVPEPSTWAGIAFLGALGIGRLGRRLFVRFARN